MKKADVADSSPCADEFRKARVDMTLTITTPCRCYGVETVDMEKKDTIKAVWGLSEQTGNMLITTRILSAI